MKLSILERVYFCLQIKTGIYLFGENFFFSCGSILSWTKWMLSTHAQKVGLRYLFLELASFLTSTLGGAMQAFFMGERWIINLLVRGNEKRTTPVYPVYGFCKQTMSAGRRIFSSSPPSPSFISQPVVLSLRVTFDSLQPSRASSPIWQQRRIIFSAPAPKIRLHCRLPALGNDWLERFVLFFAVK